ncbi:amino acid adenylation domain-containing protein [Solihabitans fulvus]|uniref:Amino acid adenylation domain-containing protein n=1 Tax=Solihabitans fulvus TaxID=1892852 RepID=A0A5B2XEB6_9PSEU|nr:non-ribosomal peptide synthetase [Solihabitans fulvus]KAA2261399.1 amino acid adenylation domain-containing protein [Solihabitans fulvus]
MTAELVAPPETLPITESQKGLLVVDSLVPTRQIYNQIMQFDLDPARCDAPLVDVVRRALAVLVTVQPALRQVFGRNPDLHATLLAPPDADDLPLETIAVAPGEYAATLAEVGRTIGRTPFDLGVGPVYRFAFVHATDGSAASILLCAHHTVGDGVSMAPIVRDLDRMLTGTMTEDVETLRIARETAFRKELAAQNRVASSEKTAEKAAAWAERLRAVPPLVLYPRPNRPTQTDFAGTRISWTTDEAEAERMQATCKRLGVSPFVLLAGVYGAVVARHGGVSSVLVGSPFAARRTIGAFDLCGFFVNTLPVTVDVDWTRTVDEHLSGPVRAEIDFCRSAVDVPFNRLVAQVQPDRPRDRNPLFSCMLAMQDTFDASTATGPVIGIREPSNGTAKFDLWIGATPVNGRWQLDLDYDRALITPAVADGILDSMRTALRRAITDGSRTLAELFDDASTTQSRRTDGYAADVPAPTLSEWFDETARSTPDAIAIEESERRLTFAELAGRANRVAAGLAGHGVGPGDVVGLRLDALGDNAVAILATLRRGAAYLPLDASLPADRLAYMVNQAGCRVIIGSGLDVDGASTVAIAALESDEDVPSAADRRSGVYVMFTSGSTGRPKGVLMGHPPLLNLAAWSASALNVNADTRFLQYAPAGFDVSFQEIVPTLLLGGTVVAREPADRRDFPAMVRRVAETAVTHLYLPVAALRPFVLCAQAQRTRLPALRTFCVSGEQLLVDDEIRAFFDDHPHCALVNHYGPTETQAVTTQRLAAGDPPWARHVPIGLPMPNVTAYVVDGTGHLAPAGVAGELFLGGCSPAHGYINDPERTADRFAPGRFEPDGILYRTGDQVVRDEHDTLIFLGRGDTQVKIRGHRVELGELETVATEVPGIRQAVAAVRGDGADRELLLFLVSEAGVDHDTVREHLGARLPAHMMPALVVDIESVPTSGTGKTNRAALVELASKVRAEEPVTVAEYADDLERDLAEIWAGVLTVPTVERDVPVLQYGAHSLNIFTALGLVQQRFGVAVSVVDFFRAPTIATLANLVREGLK